MTTAKPDDLFVINRNDTTYAVRQDELMDLIQPTDYMAINRNDITYKITGEEVIDSFIPDIIFNAVILNNYNPVTREVITVTLDVSGGQPPYTITYVWKYMNQTTGVPETVIDGATTSSLYIPDELAGYKFACEVTFEDNRGSSATKQSDYTEPAVLFAEPPVISSVDLTIASSGTNRFTSETFSAKVTLSNDGIPASTKGIIAYADGSFIQATESAPIESIQITPANHTSRLSTNDPLGVQNAASMFDGNDSTTCRVRSGYYIQYEFPFPVPWERDGDPYSMKYDTGMIATYMPPGAYSTLRADFSDDVTGAGNFDLLNTWAANGFGGATTISRYSTGAKYATEIKAIRYLDGGQYPSTNYHNLAYLSSDEHRRYVGSDTSASGYYLADDEYFQITFQSDLNLQYLEEGDSITVTGGSSVGKVYKIDRANRQIILTKNSDKTWPVGSTITIPPKPLIDNRLYLVIDNTGNVLDLDKNKPLAQYRTQEPNPEFLLKFPATFPGGLTPDEELVENTRLTVEVIADNGVGASGPFKDSLTPGLSLFLNKTDAQKEIVAVLAATAEYRTLLRQAEIAEQAETTLRQSLLNRGFSESAIDSVLTD